MSTDSVVETLETYFRQTPTPLICAYLYGSRARGEEHAGSDVDVAVLLQIVSVRRLGEPETNRALFDLLRNAGVIEASLAEKLYAMAGFRNVVMHGYQDVDKTIVADIVRNHLEDFLKFVAAVRRNVAASFEAP